MEFKHSAGIFANGFVLSLICYFLGAIFAFSSAAQTSSYYSNSSAVALGVTAFIFFIVAFIGSIMTVVGAYRALVKIDALQVPALPVAAPDPIEAENTAPTGLSSSP
ncbi:hypothetical protein V1639_00880 [Pseudarthrobacter sp. J75]|uniref:hypothetical protein n=1 Tax=unclassified Pseudarthrobacter TaxID=2647000 RepID=UPI002E7FE879|nr:MULTISPECIES: hypothetical protein [unclassified Pseudarthrobacter]MEE2524632.1 hypothetical protein [Pseudarthrobacter sp. J47]MEE2527581.1 hypothetical protein [Pseudarthrobacter sp. J75]